MRGIATLLSAAVFFALVGVSPAGVLYNDPAGGWLYTYDGSAAASDKSAALDGQWRHDNGSDAWDGTAPGSPSPTALGGLASDGDILRIEDALTGTGLNRRLYFMRDVKVGTEVLSSTFLDDGVTLSFRASLPADPIDLGGPNGYRIHDNGKGQFGIRQNNGLNGKIISFALITAGDSNTFEQSGLTFNSLSGTAPSGNVDTIDAAGTKQLLVLGDITEFHEFWITIRGDTSGGGTHRLDIYRDGSLTGEVYHVTAGTGHDELAGPPAFADYLALGMGKINQTGALDVDFFSYAEGVIQPTPAGLIPEPVTAALVVSAWAALAGYARRRKNTHQD